MYHGLWRMGLQTSHCRGGSWGSLCVCWEWGAWSTTGIWELVNWSLCVLKAEVVSVRIVTGGPSRGKVPSWIIVSCSVVCCSFWTFRCPQRSQVHNRRNLSLSWCHGHCCRKAPFPQPDTELTHTRPSVTSSCPHQLFPSSTTCPECLCP